MEIDTDTIEPPWAFMGGLNATDPIIMRCSMRFIYLVYNPSAPPLDGNKFNLKLLSRQQRTRLMEMLREAEDSTDNPLLKSILMWFCKHFESPSDDVIVQTAITLRDRVTNHVRNPRMYREEYKKAVKSWRDFLERDGEHLSAREVEVMLSTVDLAHIRARVFGFNAIEKIGEAIELRLSNSSILDEQTEDRGQSEAQVTKRLLNVFTETELPGFKRTRSGKDFLSTNVCTEWDVDEIKRGVEPASVREKQSEPHKEKYGSLRRSGRSTSKRQICMRGMRPR